MVAAAEAGLNVPKLREVNLHGNKRLITYDYIVGSPILCSDRDNADFRAQQLNLLIDAQLSINVTRCPECIPQSAHSAEFSQHRYCMYGAR